MTHRITIDGTTEHYIGAVSEFEIVPSARFREIIVFRRSSASGFDGSRDKKSKSSFDGS